MLRPSEKPQLALDGENDPRRFLWIAYGILYIIVIGVVSHPSIPEFFPPGVLSGLLLISPLLGISYLLRDAIQYNYEDTIEKRNGSSGLWVSMIFVLFASFATYQYRNPDYAIAGSTAFVIASFVDGIVFSKMRHQSLPLRLLISNVFAAVLDVFVFMSLMIIQGHFEINWAYDMALVVMEIFPGIVVFILGSSLFTRAMQAVNGGITRRIQRGG